MKKLIIIISLLIVLSFGAIVAASKSTDILALGGTDDQPVASSHGDLKSLHLIGRAGGRAFYRGVSSDSGATCIVVGSAERLGEPGASACGVDFPTTERPIFTFPLVGADAPSTELKLYRLDVVAIDGVAAVRVAGHTIPVVDNVASITFAQPQPLSPIQALDAKGKVIYEEGL